MNFHVPAEQDYLEVDAKTIGSDAYLDMTTRVLRPKTDLDSDKEALIYCHPDYYSNFQKWEKYIDCYEAREIYRYLHQHVREDDLMYRRRVKRGCYFNYTASIVDLIVSYIFRSPIDRQTDSKLYQELYDDADFSGRSYGTFFEIAATYAQVCGHVGILVDAPKAAPQDILSEADRKEKGIRPYLTYILPSQIKDWELDEFNNFKWVKIEIEKPQKRTWRESKDTMTRYFLIWTTDSWTEYSLFEDEVNVTDEGDHNLGVVPLVICRNSYLPGHNWFGQAMIRDIADINLAIMNWASMGDEEIFERCLNILAMETDNTNMPVQLSHANVLSYPAGVGHPPEYLTPGSSPLEMIGTWIDRGVNEIYRLSKMGGSTGMKQTREATSGIAYAYEFNETNQSLANKAKDFQQAENDIHKLYALWLGKSFDGSIEYPSEFGVQDFLLDLKVLMESRAAYSSITACKELEKKITSRMFANDDIKLREKIAKEIDDGDSVPIGITEAFADIPGGLGGPQIAPGVGERSDSTRGAGTGSTDTGNKSGN